MYHLLLRDKSSLKFVNLSKYKTLTVCIYTTKETDNTHYGYKLNYTACSIFDIFDIINTTSVKNTCRLDATVTQPDVAVMHKDDSTRVKFSE